MFEFMPDDDCCSPHFQAACTAGQIPDTVWVCPSCETEWKVADVQRGLRVWNRLEIIEVIKLRS
jgi:hypothetical protein